jgi:hypothetical protein
MVACKFGSDKKVRHEACGARDCAPEVVKESGMARRVVRSARFERTALAVLAFSALLGGCKRKSAEKCDQAKATVQSAVTSGDFASAKQWREYAYKQCEDTGALASLDQSIVSAEQQLTQKKQAEVAAAEQAQQFVSLFTQFVGANRTAPEKASKAPDCGTDAVAEKTKERWCKATRQVGTAGTFDVRYWEKDPKLVRFSTKSPKALRCEDFGSVNVIKSWDVPAGAGSVKRSHCEVTAGALQGMHVIVTGAAGAEAHVFSAEYLAADESLRKYAQVP